MRKSIKKGKILKFSHSTPFEVSPAGVSTTPQTLRNGPQLGLHKIAKIVKCNPKTVARWINRWKERKHLSDRSRSGTPRTTNTEQDQIMVDMALAEIDATSKTI